MRVLGGYVLLVAVIVHKAVSVQSKVASLTGSTLLRRHEMTAEDKPDLDDKNATQSTPKWTATTDEARFAFDLDVKALTTPILLAAALENRNIMYMLFKSWNVNEETALKVIKELSKTPFIFNRYSPLVLRFNTYRTQQMKKGITSSSTTHSEH